MEREPIQHLETFMYKGQQFSIMCRVYPSGDATQLQESVAEYETGIKKRIKTKHYPRGGMWRKNKDVARRTKGQTERQYYPGGAYSILLAGRHAVDNFGLINAGPGTEVRELEAHKQVIRQTVMGLMTKGCSLVDIEEWAKEQNTPLIQVLATKVDIHKIMARQNLQRGEKLVDSLGRKNIRVMAAVDEAAIGNLNRRIETMQHVAWCLDARTRNVAGIIRRIRALYRSLRLLFDPHYAIIWKAEDAGLPIPKGITVERGLLQLLDETNNWQGILTSMRRISDDFNNVPERPFCDNARRIAEDAEIVCAAIEAKNKPELRVALERMLEGTRWFFALDHLEQRIILPLSLLIADLRRREKARRKVTGEKGKFKITRDLAPTEFDMIMRSFSGFVKKLGWKKDGEIVSETIIHTVRPRIKPILRAIFAAMHEDDWDKVKRNLIKIEAIL